MLSNFSKVLIIHISYTALIHNEGISGIREVPRRIKFTFYNLLRDVHDEKRSTMISGCQKCQSNLARTWFSQSSLPFTEDFAMDEDQKPTMLSDLEIDFLKEQLNGFSVEGDYCFFFSSTYLSTIFLTSLILLYCPLMQMIHKSSMLGTMWQM